MLQQSPTLSAARAEEQERRSSPQWDTVAFVLIAAAVLFSRFLHPSLLLGYYQDDFFYYLKVAENIAKHGRSTFNGLYLTNGYHPLWMLVLVILCFLAHGTAFFVLLQCVSFVASLLTFLLVKRILQQCSTSNWSRVSAFALGLASLQLMRYGMEITLTLPLAAWFVWRLARFGPPRSVMSAAVLGIIASITVLSRLDSAIFVALCCLALFPSVLRTGNTVRVAVAFTAGFLPLLALYLVVQHHVFHMLTPVSGLAKQMKAGLVPSAATWEGLLPHDRFQVLVITPQLVLLAGGIISAFLPVSAEKQTEKTSTLRPVAIALSLFPLAHWSVLSILSDWYLWAWYFYSLTLGCVGATILMTQSRLRRVSDYACAAYGCVLVVYSLAYVVSGPNSIAVLESSSALAGFMDAHPGVWMMGDQAGTTGYLSHQPIIQTEGLVMDRDFLTLMRQATPLRTIAQRYNARYYAFFGAPASDTCFHLKEPANAGLTSPHMEGIACTKPIATFYRLGVPIQVIDARTIR